MLTRVAADAPYAAFQIIPTIMRQQIHRKLAEIREASRVRYIARTGEYRKFLFAPPRQHQRTTLRISHCVARLLQCVTHLVCAHILLTMTQRLVFSYTCRNLSRDSRQIDLRVVLPLWLLALQISLEVKAQDAIKVEQQADTRRCVVFVRAQHRPDHRHGTWHIEIMLDLGQECFLPGVCLHRFWREETRLICLSIQLVTQLL